jgi:hypothetical protein
MWRKSNVPALNNLTALTIANIVLRERRSMTLPISQQQISTGVMLMSHRSEKRARRVSRATNAALVAAISMEALCFAAPQSALAQSAPAANSTKPADNLEEVIVTGFRASLQSALDNKRKSTQIIESIAPEDIGKMPDQNVSESLQRLPGVSINRSGGKGTQVLINGLGNNLITLNGDVLLTGREMYSSGEGSGGAGNIQYASLEGIPSEQLGGVDVIKTPRASDREGGLGGTGRSEDPLPAGAEHGPESRRQRARLQVDWTPMAARLRSVTLVGGFKFSDDFAITASVSYDDEKTHTKEFQDQNRSQWLFTNTATPGSYVGSPIASTNTTLTPGATGAAPGQTYIDPQLAYFSDILNRDQDQGRIDWRRMELERKRQEFVQLVLLARKKRPSITYSNKAMVLGRQRPEQSPRRSGLVPRHRSDAAVLDRRQRRARVGDDDGERRRDQHAVGKQHFPRPIIASSTLHSPAER